MQDQNFDRYEKLNDSIYLEILYSDNELLKESKEILQQLTIRKLYKYVGTQVLPTPTNDKDYDKKTLETDVGLFY